MPLDMTFVVHVRQQFGDDDLDVGAFAGQEKTWSFDCPSVGPDHGLLLFQSAGVTTEQTLQINGVDVFGGLPKTFEEGATGGPEGGFDVPPHGHAVLLPLGFAWTGNVLIINPNTLRETGNVLRVASDGSNFVIDNVVVLYRTRRTGGVFDPGVLDPG